MSADFNALISRATKEPLSAVLPDVIAIAIAIEDEDFEHWARLELNGYSAENPVIHKDTIVPMYRSIPIIHMDQYGRPLTSHHG